MSRLHKGFSPTVFSTSCVLIQDSHLQGDDLQDHYPAAVPHRQDLYPPPLPQQMYHHRCTATATATATATTFACLAAGDMVPTLPCLSLQPPPPASFHQANSAVSIPPSTSHQTVLPQSASEDRSAVPALDPQPFELDDLSDGRFGENSNSDYHYFPPGLFMGAVSSLDCDQEPNYDLKTSGPHNNPAKEQTGYRSSYSLACNAENVVQNKLGSFMDYPPTRSHESYDTFDVSSTGGTYLDSCGLFLESGVDSHYGFSEWGALESTSQERNMDRHTPPKARQNNFTMLSSCKAIECLHQEQHQQDVSQIYQHFSMSSPFKPGDIQESTLAAGAAFLAGTEHEEPLRNPAMFQTHEGCSRTASNYHLTTEQFLLGTEKAQQQEVHFFDEEQGSETEQTQQHRDFCKKGFKLSLSDPEERKRTTPSGETLIPQVNKTQMDPEWTLKVDTKFEILSQKARIHKQSDCFHASSSSIQPQFHDQARDRLPEAVSPFHKFDHLSSSQLDHYGFQAIPPLLSVPAQPSATSPPAPSCDDSNGSDQSEVQSPSPGSAVSLVDVDHLLASGVTVAGFKPRPIIRKRRKITVPCEQKDDGYWQKRRKNNDSAKRSREAKKEKEKNFYRRALELECENYFLKERLGQVEAQLHALTGATPTPYSVFPSDSSSSV